MKHHYITVSSLCFNHGLAGRVKDFGRPQDEGQLHGGPLPVDGGLQVGLFLVRGVADLPSYYAPVSIVKEVTVWQRGAPHDGRPEVLKLLLCL